MRVKETATTTGTPVDRVADVIKDVLDGKLLCACGRPAVSVRRIRGNARPLCASPLCRDNASLDAQIASLRAARHGHARG